MPVWTGTAVPEESGIGEGTGLERIVEAMCSSAQTGQPGQNRLRSWQPSPMSGPTAGMFSVPE